VVVCSVKACELVLREETRNVDVEWVCMVLGSPDLREKFIKTESELFRHRFESDDATERQDFLKSMKFDWVAVSAGLSVWLVLWRSKGFCADAFSRLPLSGGYGGKDVAKGGVGLVFTEECQRIDHDERPLCQGQSRPPLSPLSLFVKNQAGWLML
jgi:hypothetical protein